MRNKGKKIKHYKGSFDTGKFKRRKIIRWILVLVVLFAASYFFAPPILDAGSKIWHSVMQPKPDSEQNPPSSSEEMPQETQQPTPTPEPTPEPKPDGDWRVVSPDRVATPELAQQTAQQLAQQGAKYAVISLKTADGTVQYSSAVPTAAGSLSATPFDAAGAASAMKQAGIVPVAEIWAYRDPLACYTDRSMAVAYGSGEGMLWLDNSAEAGGKPWLNPYSPAARQYILDLALEAVSMGYEQIVFNGVQFPLVRSTAGANFGDTQGKTFDAVLNETIQQWQTALGEKGAECWFAYSAAAVTGEDLRVAGVPVGSLAMQNLIVELPTEMPDVNAVLTACAGAAGGKQLAYRTAQEPQPELREAAKQAGYKYPLIG